MKHPPFDFCDDCGRKFPLDQLKKWLCEECRDPPGWGPPKGPDDSDYDCVTKSDDDR